MSAGERRDYLGERTPAGPRVLVRDGKGSRPLKSRSQDPLASFGWGRPGPLSRELAWALLHDATGDPAVATDRCGDFAAEVVTQLARQSFVLPAVTVLDWLARDRTAGVRRARLSV